MSRLADYFVIVGLSEREKERNGTLSGKILQRFPERDWPDTPFIEGIEWFCQPLGWKLSSERQEPRFFVSVLTDIDANRHYCACLCFTESTTVTPHREIDDEEDTLPVEHSSLDSTTPAATTIYHQNVMYAPKCLVLVSRLDYPETFRNCLGTIYTVYVENLPYSLEVLIGNILGIQIPSPGGPQVRFSIGAGDKQSLQPPLSSTLPVTSSCVYFLFQRLGIKNVLLLFCAIMTENKVLFHSKSYTRLTECCKALTALMYPFKYTHVYIPILPAPLIEVLSTPTPFLMGVHSSLQHEFFELMDVIIADIDGGSVTIPTSLSPPVPMFPAPLLDATQQSLILILQPDLAEDDLAFKHSSSNTINSSTGTISGNFVEKEDDDEMKDKQIRAVFMRLFAQLLQGYRSCLTIIRIHPKPVITFNKSGFLGAKDLIENEFISRVLESMFFTGFVNERGPPWRQIDAWDELYSNINELIKTENQQKSLVISHIKDLALQLFRNENPNPQSYIQKNLRPPEGAFFRIHQPPFPYINYNEVENIIKEGAAKNFIQSRFQAGRCVQRIVPIGPRLQTIADGRPLPFNSARRLEVLKTCILCIFDNKITDARKIFPAVMRTLEHKDARLTLCKELNKCVTGNKAVLDSQQFDLIVRLMNKALQNDSSNDEYGVAALLLPISTVFCRKLSTGIMQFAYTLIQDHHVWKNQNFWETTFYQDVQQQIKALYTPRYNTMNYGGPSALEIAAEQMRQAPQMTAEHKQEMINCEESTLYSQAIHYANRMVSLLIPLEVNMTGHTQRNPIHLDDDRSVSNSIMESQSVSAHSDEGYEENFNVSETGNLVSKMVSRFIDRVCNEGGVTADHIKSLHTMVPGVVHMHIETLESVYRESKRHPPIQKPKIQTPSLLQGEKNLLEPIRAYLLNDGREDDVLNLIPAEGALFLTNYRVIFRGTPCDRLTCEQTVTRAFPISSLLKEKKISIPNTSQLDQALPEGLQMRSSTFQMIRIAFDTETTPEQIETLRKLINKVRNASDEYDHFAFSCHGMTLNNKNMQGKVKEKNSTLRGMAMKTLLRTKRNIGIRPKTNSKRKYILSGIDFDQNIYNGGEDGNSDNEDGPGSGETLPRQISSKDIERFKERSYVKDWERLGFFDQHTGFRATTVNCIYALCRSYPAIILAPNTFSDDNLRGLSRSYKNQRIPVPTWRHRNGAMLLRGSTSLAKSMMGMLKSHPSNSDEFSGSGMVGSSSHHDQDKYYTKVIQTMPNAIIPRNHLETSSFSINSLLQPQSRDDLSSTLTPDMNRKKHSHWGSLKPNQHLSHPNNLSSIQRVPLYILGEKSQSKSAKIADIAEFLPIDFPEVRQSRNAFKKLMRACMPSSTINTTTSSASAESEMTYLKMIEQSEWLKHIQSILQLSGAIVDLIDLQESSVALCIEDGWDVTTQITSLAQLCLDPYYRTIEGFRVLIEKEWIAFGHRFAHRSNLRTSNSSSSVFAPIFLQFLDAVHQIMLQFPLAFEFNDFYLRFIAYHSVSCRFRSFLFDCELERFDLGITTFEDKRGSLNSRHVVKTSTSAGSDDEIVYPSSAGFHHQVHHSRNASNLPIGYSIFDYIEKQNSKNSQFFNFLYSMEPNRIVLRPQTTISCLEIWRYYICEELANGPPYDPEGVSVENEEEEIDENDDQLNTSNDIKRKIIAEGYNCIERCEPNAFTRLLQELKQVESERGLLAQNWRMVWDKLELPHTESIGIGLSRSSSFSSVLVRSHGRLLHKKSTYDILMKGRMAGYPHQQESFSHPHRFEKHQYATPTNCCHCDKLLWGPSNGYRCMDCGNAYHEKCTELTLKNCTKYKAIEAAASMNVPQGDTASIASSATTGHGTTSQQYYNQFSSNVAENRTHEGHLYKRGALLKSWKQRWFVLDSIKHQLRYYDAVEDSSCKGFIDLADVQSVMSVSPMPIGTKKVDERAFFDLKTNRRTYNFYAINANAAQEWVEKLQACLQ